MTQTKSERNEYEGFVRETGQMIRFMIWRNNKKSEPRRQMKDKNSNMNEMIFEGKKQ